MASSAEAETVVNSTDELQKEIARLRTQVQTLQENNQRLDDENHRLTIKSTAASRARRGSWHAETVRQTLQDPPPVDQPKPGTQLADIKFLTPVLVPPMRWRHFFRTKSKLQLSQGTGKALTFELDLNLFDTFRSLDSPSMAGSPVSSASSASGNLSSARNWKQTLLKDQKCVRQRWYPLRSSPLSALTLRQEDREQFGVPPKSCWFCYCYPIEALSSCVVGDSEHPIFDCDLPLVLWLLCGAFVYYDAKLDILRINAVSFNQRAAVFNQIPTSMHQSEGGGVKSFPLRLHPNPIRSLSYRFLEIWERWGALPVAPLPISELQRRLTAAPTAEEDPTPNPKPLRIAWINPSEVLGDDVFSMYGGFAFASEEPDDSSAVVSEKRPRYFAIDSEQVMLMSEAAEVAEYMQAVNPDIAKAHYTSDEPPSNSDEETENGRDAEEEEPGRTRTVESGEQRENDDDAAAAPPSQSLSITIPSSDTHDREERSAGASAKSDFFVTNRNLMSPMSPAQGSAGLSPVSMRSPITPPWSNSARLRHGGLGARSRSMSTATVTGLIDVSIEIAEQLQYALWKFAREQQANTLFMQDSLSEGKEFDQFDPMTWTEKALSLASVPPTPGSDRKTALNERVKFFAKLHLQVGLQLRVPVPIKLLALDGFGDKTKTFKDSLWAQDKHDLAHNNGCRVLFHLSGEALQKEEDHIKTMLRGAFKGMAELLDGKTQLLQLRASPLNTVTLPELVRVKAGIPPTAVFYSFCYPLDKHKHNPEYCACAPKSPASTNKRAGCSSAASRRGKRVSLNCPTVMRNELLTLLLRGGFLYFDASYDIVAVNAWTSDEHASSKNLLYFGPCVDLPWSAHERLESSGRWREVTHEAADKHGFAKMAWINPYEVVANHIFSRHGGLAFKKRAPQSEPKHLHDGDAYQSSVEGVDPVSEDNRAEGVFYPIVLGSAECFDVAAYEEVFSPKRYDMAIDFPVMDKDIWTETDKPSKFGNDFKRAKSGIVQGSVLFHEETKSAALGIQWLFGGKEGGATDQDQVDAIRQEFEDARKKNLITDEDVKNMEYVLFQAAEEIQVKDNTGSGAMLIQDKGHGGMMLEAFCKMPQAEKSRLDKHEVAALRIYTTSSFRCINDPLRNQRSNGAQEDPYPLPKTTRFIYEALKKMRAVHLESGSRFKPRYLWRGLRNLQVDDEFMRNGGTELACMSTSEDINVVAKYCQCDEPLVFRIRVASPMDLGADISWLSCFPHEKEVLYPPLTYLKPLYLQEMKSKKKGVVITVEVRFPS